MKIGIIGAMELEITTIKAKMTNLHSWTRGGIIFHEGGIGKHEIVLIQSGIGKVQAAITATLLINRFEVSAIINTGTAGAIDHDLEIGDLVLSEKTAYFDVDATGTGYPLGQLPGQPLNFNASKYLLITMQEAAKELKLPIKTGLIVSGDSFVNSDHLTNKIKKNYPDALAVEMEGAAVAQVAHQFNKGYLVIRSISDTASHDAHQKFDEFAELAGKNSANLVLKFIEIIK